MVDAEGHSQHILRAYAQCCILSKKKIYNCHGVWLCKDFLHLMSNLETNTYICLIKWIWMFRISQILIQENPSKWFKTQLSETTWRTINLKRKASLNSFVPKHLTECPQEDEIICTWLLRGALHKDHFSKITARLAFIPYFWKPSCFLRLPLLPLHPLLQTPSPRLTFLSCFSFHMLVFVLPHFPLV